MWKHEVILMEISKQDTGAVDPFLMSVLNSCCWVISDNIDMASQHNENVLMSCAAVMMKLTECTELLLVLFRAFDMCQCPTVKGKVLSDWCQSIHSIFYTV